MKQRITEKLLRGFSLMGLNFQDQISNQKRLVQITAMLLLGTVRSWSIGLAPHQGLRLDCAVMAMSCVISKETPGRVLMYIARFWLRSESMTRPKREQSLSTSSYAECRSSALLFFALSAHLIHRILKNLLSFSRLWINITYVRTLFNKLGHYL